MPAAKMLVEKAMSSEDPDVRAAELGGAAGSGNAEVAKYLLDLSDKRLRSFDRLMLIGGVVRVPQTRQIGSQWVLANYQKLASGNGIFFTSRLPGMFNSQCGAAEAERVEKELGPTVLKANVGLLEYRRMLERVRNCGVLKQAKGAEIAAAIAAK